MERSGEFQGSVVHSSEKRGLRSRSSAAHLWRGKMSNEAKFCTSKNGWLGEGIVILDVIDKHQQLPQLPAVA